MSPGPCKTKMFPKNPLSTKLCLPTIEFLLKNNDKKKSGNFYWFKRI